MSELVNNPHNAAGYFIKISEENRRYVQKRSQYSLGADIEPIEEDLIFICENILKLQEQLAEANQQNLALKANGECLASALSDIQQDYFAEIESKYSEADLVYPSKQRAKDNDMLYINAAMDALIDTPKESLSASAGVKLLKCSDISLSPVI